MSPYSQEMGLAEPVGSTHGAADEEIAAPDTISPTPSPSPSVTPSPPLPQVEDDEDDYQRIAAMNPPPLLQTASTDCLPIDHNLPHLLRKVSGNAELNTIRDIKLQVISREMSLQRLALFIPNLKELNLDGSCLGSLRDLGCGLASLHVLRVARCGLESLDGTFGLSSLRELHASNNQVDDIGPCSSLPNIRIIDLSKNPIDNLKAVEYLKMCPNLRELSLSECPVANKLEYRRKIRFFLPRLETLDRTTMAEDGDSDHHGNNSYVAWSEEGTSVQGPSTSRSKGDSLGSCSPTSPRNSYNSTLSFLKDTDDTSESLNCTGTFEEPVSLKSPADYGSIAKPSPRIRPATAGSASKFSNPKMRGPLNSGALKKSRPASSSAATDNGESSSTNMGDNQCDSPSALTSGIVVCGNLIMALRNRRKRVDAWTEDDQSSQKDVKCQSGNKLATENMSEEKTDKDQEKIEIKLVSDDRIHCCASRRSSEFPEVLKENGINWSVISQQEIAGQTDIESAMGPGLEEKPEKSEDKTERVSDDCNSTMDILEESRKWREMFTKYRSDNRLRWENEKDDNRAEPLDAASMYTNPKNIDNPTSCEIQEEKPRRKVSTARKVDENKKSSAVIKKFQGKNPTCCPHLFKPANNTSCDADSRSGSDVSTRNVKTTGKKKAL